MPVHKKDAATRCFHSPSKVKASEMQEQQPAKEFRFNAIKGGFTWSCPVNQEENPIQSKEDLLKTLESVSTVPIEQYLISVERHETGKKHYHAYVRWTKKIDISNSRAFDCCGVHPNILTGIKKAWEHYVAKEKDYITNYYIQKVTKYSEALEALTVEEGLQILEKNHPRDYLLQRDRIHKNLTDHHNQKRKIQDTTAYQWSEYGEYVVTLVKESWMSKTIILHGPTNVGKTALAKWMGGSPMLVSHLDQLRNIPATTSHLIFDDMSFSHLPRTTILHLVDLAEDRAIHIRYGMGLIRAGLPRILTTNRRDFLGREGEESRQYDPAIERRICWIDVENKLY